MMSDENPTDNESMYSQADLDSLLVNKIIEYRLGSLELLVKTSIDEIKKSINEQKANTELFRNSLYDCKSELQKEIEDDFLTKDQAIILEGRLETQFKIFRTQIFTALAVLAAFGAIFQYVLVLWDRIDNINNRPPPPAAIIENKDDNKEFISPKLLPQYVKNKIN